MKNIKMIFTVMFVIFTFTTNVFAGPFNASAKTKRIPAGTTFQLEFLQPVSTFSGNSGDSFVATLLNEQTSGTSVILPAGTIVRGSILDVKTAKYFSRGAKLYLDFDHVVTPTGRQIPLEMAVAQFDKIYYDGSLYKNLGYGEAIQNNYNKASEITKRATEYGKKAGESAPGIEYLTTPICAIGGFIGGAGYFIGDSIADIFRKGQDVYINTGDIMNVKLINPIDIPVY
ncbi:hypothetical protein J6R97_07570 [bacterium]|nr:hypothetical protein [bacterium]